MSEDGKLKKRICGLIETFVIQGGALSTVEVKNILDEAKQDLKSDITGCADLSENRSYICIRHDKWIKWFGEVDNERFNSH